MVDLRISDLNAANNLQSTDLVGISQDQGDGTYVSRNIAAANFDIVGGRRDYGTHETDPSSPVPKDGDRYYNTILQ